MNLIPIELKTFIPSKDFEISKQFYKDLGFIQKSEGGGIANFSFGHISFLLQDYYVKEYAENIVLHFLVENVWDWHSTLV